MLKNWIQIWKDFSQVRFYYFFTYLTLFFFNIGFSCFTINTTGVCKVNMKEISKGLEHYTTPFQQVLIKNEPSSLQGSTSSLVSVHSITLQKDSPKQFLMKNQIPYDIDDHLLRTCEYLITKYTLKNSS